jgi:diguanylate cyclase (GGDEF)-like protein
MGLMLQGHWNSATHSALAHLEALTTVDTLTQLANRTLWHDRLSQAITAARREEDHRSVLMIVDLNHFKTINDALGHPTGDIILRETALRLKTALREADTLARLGGDEFGILLPNHQAPWEAAHSVAQKILGCFERPFAEGKEELFVSAAIGIAVYPEDGETVSSLVSHAEIAMYHSKREGMGFHFYQASADKQQMAQLQLSNQLHHALENQELELHYQPKIDLRDKRLCGTEALLRWRHPQLGLLNPDQFITLAEKIGLITPITEWVLNTALEQHNDWHNIGHEIPVSVNISALSFKNPKLLDTVKTALQRSGVAPHNLEIEITENTLLTGMDHCRDTVDALSQLGARIAIDDFGTGYSSLSYLRQLPIDTLKIDKSFVQNMKNNHSDVVIVRSIIELGHNLGFSVVAEGVETDNTYMRLRYLHCDIAQGYFIGTPMTEVELSNWLGETAWAIGWQ